MIVWDDGEQHGQDGAGPGGAVHGHAAAYGLHPVAQAGQARAAAGFGAAGAVVADLDRQEAAGLLEEDVRRILASRDYQPKGRGSRRVTAAPGRSGGPDPSAESTGSTASVTGLRASSSGSFPAWGGTLASIASATA
jgi:hypothetical protein